MQINIFMPSNSECPSNVVRLVRLPVHLARCITAPVCVDTCPDEQDEMRDTIPLSISVEYEM